MYDKELTYEDLLEIDRECDEIVRRYLEACGTEEVKKRKDTADGGKR